jgi:hypothetical protein
MSNRFRVLLRVWWLVLLLLPQTGLVELVKLLAMETVSNRSKKQSYLKKFELPDKKVTKVTLVSIVVNSHWFGTAHV